MPSLKEFDALKTIVTQIEDATEQLAVKDRAAKELLAIQDAAETKIAKKHGLSGPNDNAFSQYDAEVQADPNFKKAAKETDQIMKEKKTLSDAIKASKTKAKTAKAALDKVLLKADKKIQAEVIKFYAEHKAALA